MQLLQDVSLTSVPTALAVIDQNHCIVESSAEWRLLLQVEDENTLSLPAIMDRANDKGYYFFDCLRRVKFSKVAEQCYSLFVWSAQEFDWIRWSIRPIPDSNYIFVHAQKITKELHFQQFFDLSMDIVMSTDSAGNIKSLNHYTLQLLGYSYEEMIGQSLFAFVLPEDHHKTRGVLKSFDTQQKLTGFVNRYHCKNDNVKWIQWSASYYANTGFIYSIGRDITQNVEEKRVLQQNHDTLDALSYIQKLYIAGADIRELFNVILSKLLILTQSEYGFIGRTFQNEKGQPYLKVYAISDTANYAQNTPHDLEFHHLDTLFGYTIRTGKMVICNDPENDLHKSKLSENYPELKRYLGLPIEGRHGMLGMLGVANRQSDYNRQVIAEIEPLLKVISAVLESYINGQEVEKLAHYDFLTQLYNRAYFEKKLQQMKECAAEKKDRLALFYLDLNNFKGINDTLGHKSGDMLLYAVAKRLKSLLHANDILARLGGDEFGIIIPDLGIDDYFEQRAQAIVAAMQAPFAVASSEVVIGISVGIAIYPDSTTATELLYKFADYALYHAKARHEGYRLFSQEIENLRSRRLQMENHLDDAIALNQFFFEFQPIYDCVYDQTVGVECLLRWQHPTLGIVSPAEFVEVFEDLGKADKLNLYVAEKVRSLPRDLVTKRSCKPFTFSLNLSPNVNQFAKNFNEIASIIAKVSAAQTAIKYEFELTESSLIDNEAAVECLSSLDASGVSIAIDDFGIAHSSLLRLKTLPINTLKLDFSIIKDIVTEKKTRIIVASVIDLASKLDLNVIAEGVETRQQFELLEQMGCQTMQGYYFSKPLTLDKLKVWLNNCQNNDDD